ncbi:MAG: hypothetical protein QXI42_02290 [Thermoproteota archaeon]
MVISIKELAEQYFQNAVKILAEQELLKNDYEKARDAAMILLMDREKLEAILEKIALQYGGCVSCCYSRPYPGAPVKLLARSCALGLNQEGCRKWERIR